MTSPEERMRILEMIQDRHISAEEGARLLAALGNGPAEEEGSEGAASRTRWLRVRVTNASTGKQKVSVNIPIGLVDVGLKMGARFAPEMDGMDLSVVHAAIKEGLQGKIMEVEDQEDNERVEIFVE